MMYDNEIEIELFEASLPETTQILDENTVDGRVYYELYDYHRDSHKFGVALLNPRNGKYLLTYFGSKEEIAPWIENMTGVLS